MPIPEQREKIRQQPMRDEVYDTLLTWIMEGVLQPGEKVVDKELAGHMGVSRTPVREALRRLEDKRLVESSANRWTRVAPIPAGEPEMIYPLIWTLEGLALSDAANKMTQGDFINMAAANEDLKQAIAAANPVASAWADNEFHRIFIERSGNLHLIRILEDLKIRYRRLEITYFEGSGRDNASVQEHEKILSALRVKNTDLALDLNRRNWEKSLNRLTQKETLA